jgi:hypothetical protein
MNSYMTDNIPLRADQGHHNINTRSTNPASIGEVWTSLKQSQEAEDLFLYNMIDGSRRTFCETSPPLTPNISKHHVPETRPFLKHLPQTPDPQAIPRIDNNPHTQFPYSIRHL